MTDQHEKRLLDAYNRAVDALNRIPKGDPRHIPASAKVVNAHRALQRYRARNKN
jgi:hypothetical protein